MTYYLIFDKKNFGLKWSYILKVMNFIIFRDLFRIFLKFFEFILIKNILKFRFKYVLIW